MHKRSIALAVTLLMLPAVGCNKIKARLELKQGNAFYENEEYKPALGQFQKGLELDPDASFAWRSVGLSALALFKPGDKSPENMGYATTAIDAFEKYLADPEHTADEKIRDYLLSTYMSAEQFDRALAYIDQQMAANPGDTKLLKTKIIILIKAERFDDAANAAMSFQGPEAPEILYTLGVTAWDKSYNDPKYSLPEREHIVDLGLAATDKALQLKPEYFEAMAYYNLLFREKAKMASDPAKRQEYLDKAEEWKNKAIEVGKKASAAAKPPQPPAEG
ncbi:MAG TPA: hypothetical protein VN783_13395 [Thermoanaerobaculia bacterium]|nr:hypothetical protein [Thermoanaerobaculia bacterium]